MKSTKSRKLKKNRDQSRAGLAKNPAVQETAAALTTGSQASDLQGLSDVAEADSESVAELADEGQPFEAEILDAIENSPDPDVAEVRTREIPEDDVPAEYLEGD